MRKIERIAGEGELKENERVSAVFTVDFLDHSRFALRELLTGEAALFGLDPRGFYLGFPSTSQYTGESYVEAAKRAAKQWGFDVEHIRHVRTEQYGDTSISYHFCRNLSTGIYEPITSFQDDQSPIGERHMMFLTKDDAIQSEYVTDETKVIIGIL